MPPDALSLDAYQKEVLRTAPRELAAYPECVRAAHEALLWIASIDEQNGEPALADPARANAAQLLRTFDQLIWCLGLAGEVGETLDLLKKSFGHGHPLDRAKLKKEFGDVRWYGAALEDSFGFASSEVARANVEKLRARYPSAAGFTIADSIAKADEKP
jgi:NTP pyrophosphatase (non-canonical NTP hydrolase)